MVINLQRYDFKVKDKPRRKISLARCTGVCKKRSRNSEKNREYQCDESFKRVGQDGLPKASSPGLSGLLEWKKNKKTPHKANLENERKESSDTGENSFQASKKIYESDNDVMGSLRIKHILLVPNVCKRLDMFRTWWCFVYFSFIRQ